MQSALYAIASLSHEWMGQKRLKLGCATFTTEYPNQSSFCGINLIQKFWRVPPEWGRQTRVGWGRQAIF